jgi:hypothetical protein
VALLSGTVYAQSTLRQISADGNINEITLTQAELAGEKAIFWFESAGKESHALTFYAEAPAAAKLRLSMRSRESYENAAALAQSGFDFETMALKLPDTSKWATELPFSGSAPGSACNQVPADILAFLKEYNDRMGGSAADLELLCRSYLAETGGAGQSLYGLNLPPDLLPYSGNSSLQAYTILHKNSCLAGTTVKYVVRFELDLSAVDASLMASGLKLRFAAASVRYKGDKVASVKARGDGMYPEPLILMASVAPGNEKFFINSWSGNHISKKRILKVAKYAPHRGHTLAVGRIKPYINGRKASFELSNGFYTYSVCFKLKAERQYANGYPR